MQPGFEKLLREQARYHTGEVWEKGKAGESLAEEDRRLYQVMLMHPEYHEYLDNAKLLGDKEVVHQGGNPFLHLSLHLVVANQLATKTPPEVGQAVFRLTRRGEDEHEVLHKIMNVFSDMYREVMKNNRPFEASKYASRLRAL